MSGSRGSEDVSSANGAARVVELFKIASQECEPTYFRTLDVQEKYYPDSLG